MRVPQVTDRLKEAPAQALRAVFSGVGSVLLVADRLRHRAERLQAHGHDARSGAADVDLDDRTDLVPVDPLLP